MFDRCSIDFRSIFDRFAVDLGWILGVSGLIWGGSGVDLGGSGVDLGGFWVDPGWTWDGCGVALAALFGYSIDVYVMSRNT